MLPTYTFTSQLWVYDGDAAWHFITLPTDVAAEIRAISSPRRGFGSVRVKASIGEVTWNTSIFPDSKSGSFVLPVKKEVRTKNKITTGDKIETTLALIDI
jgi:hypothetical protein